MESEIFGTIFIMFYVHVRKECLILKTLFTMIHDKLRHEFRKNLFLYLNCVISWHTQCMFKPLYLIYLRMLIFSNNIEIDIFLKCYYGSFN